MTEQTPVEMVLVVPSSLVELVNGVSPTYLDGRDLADEILNPSEWLFQPRDKMETDESFRQLIPYVVFVFGESVWTYQRMKGQGEKRLHGKFSVGVGGHINPVDGELGDAYLNGMYRELREEIEIQSPIKRHVMVGFINDESNPVGRVHLGVLHVVELEGALIKPIDKSMLDCGFQILDPKYLDASEFETWSQHVIEFLQDVSFWQDLENDGVTLPTDGFKVKLNTPTDAPESLTIVGNPISVSEFIDIVDRVHEGKTTMDEEMAKNLESFGDKHHPIQYVVQFTDTYRVAWEDVTLIRKDVPLDQAKQWVDDWGGFYHGFPLRVVQRGIVDKVVYQPNSDQPVESPIPKQLNEHQSMLVATLNNLRGDDLARLEMQAARTPLQMDEQWGQSGKTLREHLEDARSHNKKISDAISWVIKQDRQ